MAATADSSQGLRKRPVESSKPSSPVSSEAKQKAAPKGRPNVTVSASSVLCNFDGGMALGSNDIKELTFTTNEKTSEDAELGFSVAFYVMTLLTVVTRLWGIGHPSQVVFDEVHFGKFASYYLRREYFFDVHPPLAKMLIALAGFFLGYDGHFLFENIGDDYITNHVPHIGFRVFCASFGILVVPVAFLTLKEMGLSLPATILGSALLLLDNATIAQTRLILLDSQLMLFCTLTVYCWVRFYKQRFEPFKKQWWKWLILTGVSLALTLGVKMVGLFAFATIGTATIVDLWERLDIKRGLTIREFARHFSARALCLIFLPLALYLSFFYVHFLVLTKSGPGDDFMSTAFQEGLEGNKILSATTIIPYYSNITLKHKSKVWLHSHQDKYPLRYKDGRVSSQGQQITGYPHQDQNNLWVLEPVDPEMYKQAPKYVPDEKEKTREVRYLKNNDIVRLRHFMTDSYLITHDVASPMTPTNMEMTTIASNLADTRYVETLWHIEIPDPNLNDNILIESNRYDIRVRNVQHAVALTNTKKVLPDWGFKQNEINGNKKIDELANNWMIDSVQHERMVDGEHF
jgi:dolichyl-phosphate-mannose-protein mannosyltransferase